MSECAERICYVKDMCHLYGGCIIEHRLFEGKEKHVYNCVKAEIPSKREKILISFMSEKEKMKVRGSDVNKYFCTLIKRGIDLDKESPRKRLQKNKIKRKPPIRTSKRKTAAVVMREISREVFKKINSNPSPAMNRRPVSIDEFYQKAQKPSDIIEKWKNEPEPNFHESE